MKNPMRMDPAAENAPWLGNEISGLASRMDRNTLTVAATESQYFLGVDLGQAHDPTALAIVDRRDIRYRQHDPVTWERYSERQFTVRLLERIPLGTSYPDVVRRVAQIVSAPVLRGRISLVLDATGVGRPVVDMMREARLGCPLAAVTITGGDQQSNAGWQWRVPKRNLIAGLQAMVQMRTLRIPRGLPGAGELVKEMLGMRMSITLNRHETYGAWREGDHDDLVLALALAVWKANLPNPPFHGQTRIV